VSSLRNAFANLMVETGAQDEKIVVIVGDISHGLLKNFRETYPDRYFNIGICEPATVNIAAGLSHAGLIPIVHTIAPFLIERSFEQIKLDFGYQDLSGNFVSVGSSFDYSKLGCSHHSYADVSLMAHLPNSQIFLPGSALEFEIFFRDSYKSKHINYFRLTENPHGIEIPPEDIKVGKAITVREGTDLTVLTTGSALRNCYEAGNILEQSGISSELIYLPTFKPFDSDAVRKSIMKTKKFITVEELSAQDGVFSAVLRSIIGIGGVTGKQMAIFDFLRTYGSYPDLQNAAGLSTKHIVQAAHDLLPKRIEGPSY
jgi:transketolase